MPEKINKLFQLLVITIESNCKIFRQIIQIWVTGPRKLGEAGGKGSRFRGQKSARNGVRLRTEDIWLANGFRYEDPLSRDGGWRHDAHAQARSAWRSQAQFRSVEWARIAYDYAGCYGTFSKGRVCGFSLPEYSSRRRSALLIVVNYLRQRVSQWARGTIIVSVGDPGIQR